MPTAIARRNAADAVIGTAIRAALASAGRHGRNRAALERLLRHARDSRLLRPNPLGGRFDVDAYVEVVDALLALAMHHRRWIRPVEAWEPVGLNPRPIFASLARHLLAAYPVPGFMTSVWFQRRGDWAQRQQAWYVHIGAGQNIRTADLPLPYTKKMAHHFLRAPDDLSVEGALRFGQVRGLGGSRPLALAVARTRLGRLVCGPAGHEAFWRTVVQFFVNHEKLELVHIDPIVDYLHHQRFASRDVCVEGGVEVDLGPAQPNLSMKGRTPRSLLRQVADWKRHSGLPRRLVALAWKPSGIGAFRLVERDDAAGFRCWTIRELTSSAELYRDGEAMRHCVLTYAGRCARRTSSIWSLQFENGERRFRVMTIAVDPATRTIEEARRRGNAPPNDKTLGIVRQWAAREGLLIHDSVEAWANRGPAEPPANV